MPRGQHGGPDPGRPFLAVAWAVLAACSCLAQAGEPAGREGLAFFESKVRPVLVEQCRRCHGAEKAKGGLRLDSREAAIRGGDSGPAVVPGRPDQSPLVSAVTYRDDLKMPPRGKLPADQVAALREWVAMGAPWPDSGAATAAPAPGSAPNPPPDAGSSWAFRPLADPPIPSLGPEDRGRAGSPVDAFLLGPLRARGLAPAEPAARRDLIRRLTYDLTGLPPTPEEVDDFLSDGSPLAYAKLVDRLLASPHHGERWARRWLDVVRYADSNGMDENLAFGHAWRYRDYVVRSLNADLPYDEFVREQVAGDLLGPDPDPSVERRRLEATGLLVIGPKMLAEDDPVKMEMDIVDEQVDTVGKAFLGLTLGCARCHDHKFDPITTADYYGLAGVFKSTRTMEHFRVVARWNERPLAASRELEEAAGRKAARVRAKQEELERRIRRANDGLLSKLTREASPGTAVSLPKDAEARYPREEKAAIDALRKELAAIEAEPLPFPPVMAVADREGSDLRVHIRGNPQTLGPVVPRSFPAVIAGAARVPTGPGRSGRAELAAWLTGPDQPLARRVIANRLWLWHFGEGLVRSPDNFGRLGERPTHPELLDWLARRLEEEGWSLKVMHRLIVHSEAYRMGTAYDPKAAAADPENRLLWRRDRRRLDAEEVRDTVLFVSGRLDRAMGGSLLKTADRAYVAGTASVDGTNYESRRRSIYLPVIRSALFEVFQAFDFADPSTGNGRRDVTTVAPQALCLMNSDMVNDAARALAREVAADRPGPVEGVYRRALLREPSGRERERALEFLDRYEYELAALPGPRPDAEARRRLAIEGLCRAILGSSELLFVN